MLSNIHNKQLKGELLNKSNEKEYIMNMTKIYNESKNSDILDRLLEKYYMPLMTKYREKYNENKEICIENKILVDDLCIFEELNEKVLFITENQLIYMSGNEIKTIEINKLIYRESRETTIIKNHIIKKDLLLLESKTGNIFSGKKELASLDNPLYFLYEKEILNIMFQLENMNELLCNDRIVWLLEDSSFDNYFKDTQSIIPHLSINLSEKELAVLAKYEKEMLEKKENAINEYTRYYSENSENIIKNIKNGKPKVLFLTRYHEFVINTSYSNRTKEIDLTDIANMPKTYVRTCAQTLRDIGCCVIVVSEKSIVKSKEIDIYLKINEFKPDIIFGSSLYFRFSFKNIPKEVVFITWAQDLWADVMDKLTPSKLGNRDFLLNHVISSKEFYDVGYSEYTIIDAPTPADDKIYKPYLLTREEDEMYSCDICIFGSYFSDYWWENTIRDCYQNDKFIDTLFEIRDKYRNDVYNEVARCDSKEDFIEYIKREITDRNIIIYDDKVYEDFSLLVFIYMTQAIYRITLIDWLIDAGYKNIKVWGRNWDEFMNNPRYSDYIMGIADTGENLSKILQSSKIVIGSNSLCTAAIRVWETMLSKGFYIANYIPQGQDYVDLRLILKEHEEFIMFYNKKDLLNKVKYYLENEDERYKMIEIGYKRAKELMTFEVLMKKILKEISKRL